MHKNKIPKKYHDAVRKVDEVRVGFILIPDSVIISPRNQEKELQLYGVTWRPIGLGIPLKIGNAKLTMGTGLVFTYMYVNIGNYKLIDQEKLTDIDSENSNIFLDQVTHFLRPGIDLRLALELKFSPFFLTSIGWASAYYIPQKIGGGVFELSKTKSQNLWRVHHGAFLLNFRFPYEAQL
ncbi:MAG: hypothetical protein AB8G05_14920 [Oligoflexales bacterium]